MTARYWIAQHITDLFRKEPQNVGVMIECQGKVAARFLGELGPGQIDGRKLRAFKYPDVYKQWVEFWREESKKERLEKLVDLNGAHYRLIEGGEVDDESSGNSAAEDFADYLYALLVSEGGLTEALRDGSEEIAVVQAAALADEVASSFAELSILVVNEPIFIRHPIQRFVPVRGSIGVEHRPAFVQDNGHRFVIETADFTARNKRTQRDHAGWAAYMFRDLKSVDRNTETIAIVRAQDTDREVDDVKNGLALLRAEAQIVDWLNPKEKDDFLTLRKQIALGY